VSILAVVATLGTRMDTLERTLRSIRSQDAPSVDMVLVTPKTDDAGIRRLASKYSASVDRDPGSGLTAALSVGLEKARGQLAFMWLADDDELTDGSLNATWTALRAVPDRVMVYGNVIYVDAAGDQIAASGLGQLAPRLMGYGPNLLPQPGSLALTEAVRSVGGFDDDLKYAPDLDLFLRLKSIGKIVHIDRLVARYTWHPDALTVKNRLASLREAEAVRRRYRRGLGRVLGYPADWATRVIVTRASRRLTSRARKMEGNARA